MSLEFLIVFPSVLLAVLVALNAGLWFHARNIALSAAEEGVRVARTHAEPGDGVQAARRFAIESGDGILIQPKATLGGNADTVEITVTGEAVSLVPGLTLSISQTARAPRERFTVPGAP
ncbi:TadE/TadG family type IV pilus assembly protein [Actinomadura rayongensis]|uniref:Pilus assembly protein n=1 Tax=Actinomadura rayongensis TaxID=1429076 RepID=A0A6I4WGA9_9ACTN|nr:TadE family protein [Actinomadura rayongensis]MXQ65622.1 pilus assembly protein [Actinomadura rayongensis]